MSDLTSAVRCSFSFGVFTVGQQLFAQRQGSPMGSPLSPALCHAVVSDFEHRIFHAALFSIPRPAGECLFITRYVDNRLTICDVFHERSSVMQHFLSADVYLPPLELEYEDGYKFLGFTFHLFPLQATSCLPQEPWQFLHPQSATSVRLIASSLYSRAMLVARCAWPIDTARTDADTLIKMYIHLGVSSKHIRRAQQQVLRILTARHSQETVCS
jgi:hypothetical protein